MHLKNTAKMQCPSRSICQPPVKKKMIPENRKYCPLFPREHKNFIKNMGPNFQHCKTAYTKCDFNLETCVQEQLLKLEDQFRAHHDLIVKEKKIQYEVCKELWITSTRYSILTRGGLCYKPYPEVVSKNVEHNSLCDFHTKIKEIYKSNCRLAESMHNIKVSMDELNRRIGLLDMTVESTFLRGDEKQPSLKNIQETVTEMYEFYNEHFCKLLSWAQLIDPGDTPAIEDYQTLVNTTSIGDEKFGIISKEDCFCLRKMRATCFEPYHACK